MSQGALIFAAGLAAGIIACRTSPAEPLWPLLVGPIALAFIGAAYLETRK